MIFGKITCFKNDKFRELCSHELVEEWVAVIVNKKKIYIILNGKNVRDTNLNLLLYCNFQQLFHILWEYCKSKIFKLRNNSIFPPHKMLQERSAQCRKRTSAHSTCFCFPSFYLYSKLILSTASKTTFVFWNDHGGAHTTIGVR